MSEQVSVTFSDPIRCSSERGWMMKRYDMRVWMILCVQVSEVTSKPIPKWCRRPVRLKTYDTNHDKREERVQVPSPHGVLQGRYPGGSPLLGREEAWVERPGGTTRGEEEARRRREQYMGEPEGRGHSPGGEERGGYPLTLSAQTLKRHSIRHPKEPLFQSLF